MDRNAKISLCIHNVIFGIAGKKQSIANITNCAKELINYSGDILDFAKSHSSLTATTALAPHILQKIDPKKLVNRVITKLIPAIPNMTLWIHREILALRSTQL